MAEQPYLPPNQYTPGPKNPIFIQGVTLAASEIRVMDVVEVRKLFVSGMVKYGTSSGEVSIALGPMGDFFDLSPGDIIELSMFGQIRLRNNVAAARSFQLILANDPNFGFDSLIRGV